MSNYVQLTHLSIVLGKLLILAFLYLVLYSAFRLYRKDKQMKKVFIVSSLAVILLFWFNYNSYANIEKYQNKMVENNISKYKQLTEYITSSNIKTDDHKVVKDTITHIAISNDKREIGLSILDLNNKEEIIRTTGITLAKDFINEKTFSSNTPVVNSLVLFTIGSNYNIQELVSIQNSSISNEELVEKVINLK